MIGRMLTSLKGGTLWAVVAIILAILGCTTYLASQGIISGGDMLTIVTTLLAAVGIVTGAHVAANTAITAVNTPAPGAGAPPAPSAPPAPAPTVPASTLAQPVLPPS